MQTVATYHQNETVFPLIKPKLTDSEKWYNALTKEELKESIRTEMKTWNWKNEHKVFATS